MSVITRGYGGSGSAMTRGYGGWLTRAKHEILRAWSRITGSVNHIELDSWINRSLGFRSKISRMICLDSFVDLERS